MLRNGPTFAGRAVAAWFGAFAVCLTSFAAEPQVPVDCHSVRLPPRQQRLSQVLAELSAVRKFRLENRTREDPVVRHSGGNQVDVMRALSGQANLLARYKPATDCPGMWTLEIVWVLPRELHAPTPAKVAATPTAKEQADAAAAKQSMDLYLRAHGIGPAQPPSESASQASR